MNIQSDWNSRTLPLIGTEGLDALAKARVILFGCGGVGGWTAEVLIRSGVRNLTLVDKDVVEPSNFNRQLVATIPFLEKPKVDALKERLLSINPEAKIQTLYKAFTASTAEDFALEEHHVVLDAIDSVADKALLIRRCSEIPSVTLFSAMGAARRLDPLQVCVTEFSKVKGCPLARALRTRFKKENTWPTRKFLCVWSTETPVLNSEKGSLAPVVGTFGMALASLAINEIIKRKDIMTC